MSIRPGRGPRTQAAADPPAAGIASTRALLGAIAACLAVRLLASAASSNWLWGLDTLRGWPASAALALAAVAAAGFTPPIAGAIGRALARLGAAWDRRPARGDALACAVVSAIVFLLRDPVQFVGDSSLRSGALTFDAPMARLFPQAFPLDLAVNIHLARALAATGLAPLTGLQLAGALLACVFALASLSFLRAVGARGAMLPAAALVLLGGGYVVHFAGYDKYGPLLVGIALAAAGSARLAAGGRGAWMLAAGTVTCLLATRLGYAVLPPALLSLALAWRRGAPRAPVTGAAVVIVLAGLAMLPRTLDIVLGFDRRVHAAGGAVARALESPGGPDLLIRLSDTLNLLFFLVPLWPVGIVAVLRAGRARTPGSGRDSGLGAVAWLAIALQVAIVFGIRARQGVMRDWDAYVGVGLVVALAVTAALVSRWRAAGSRGEGGTIPAAVTVALFSATLLWGLHAGESMAMRRIESQLAARPAWSEAARAAAHDHLGLRALRLSRFEEAARRFESAIAAAPNPRFFYQAGLAHLDAGQLDRAEEAFGEAVRRYRFIADPWIGLARVSLARGDTLGAMVSLDSALARDPRHVEAAEARRSLEPRAIAP